MIILVRREIDATGYLQSDDSVKILGNELEHIARFDYYCWLKKTGIELEINQLNIFKFERVGI